MTIMRASDAAGDVQRILALPQSERSAAVKAALAAIAGDAEAVQAWQDALIAHLSSTALGTVVFPLAGLRKFYIEHEDVMRAAFSADEMRCLGVTQAVLAIELGKVACRYSFDVRLARHIDKAMDDAVGGEPGWLSDIARAVRDASET